MSNSCEVLAFSLKGRRIALPSPLRAMLRVPACRGTGELSGQVAQLLSLWVVQLINSSLVGCKGPLQSSLFPLATSSLSVYGSDGCFCWHDLGGGWWADKEERGQQPAGRPPRLSSGPGRAWGPKWRTEAHVLYHKILGTLHLHRSPENTRRDSVYNIPGLCFLIPAYKNNSPTGWDHGEIVRGHMPWSELVLTDGWRIRFFDSFGKKKSEGGNGAGE